MFLGTWHSEIHLLNLGFPSNPVFLDPRIGYHLEEVRLWTICIWGWLFSLPRFTGAVVKNLPDNARDEGDVCLIPSSGRSPGIGNGNPLQCSCLENSMDRGVWQARVHGVTKIRSWLSTALHSDPNQSYLMGWQCLAGGRCYSWTEIWLTEKAPSQCDCGPLTFPHLASDVLLLQ